MTWRATVLTLFPDMFPGPLGESIAGRSQSGENPAWVLETVDIRDFASDKHRRVDDTPFGGGAGMVLRPDVVDAALTSLRPGGANTRRTNIGSAGQEEKETDACRFVYPSPRGRVFDQGLARELAAGPGVVILCGRYEGVDQRVLDAHGVEEVSLGDFVLSGGELAAMAFIDAVVRLLPGVMGNGGSAAEESFGEASGHGDAVLLEYPHYTRPADWVGLDGVRRLPPEVLLSGNHGRIDHWRRSESERITRERRPDLWRRYRAMGYGRPERRRGS